MRPDPRRRLSRDQDRKDNRVRGRYWDVLNRIHKGLRELLTPLGLGWWDQYVDVSRGQIRFSITPYEPPTRSADGEISGAPAYPITLSLPVNFIRAALDDEYVEDVVRDLAVDYVTDLAASENVVPDGIDLTQIREQLLAE